MGEGQSKIASDGEESGGHHKGSGKSNASTQPNGGQTLQKDGESESAEQYGEKTEKFGTSTDADANKEVKAVDAGASKTHAKSGETQETEKANGVSGEAQDSTTDNTGTSERQEDSDKVEGKQEPSVGAQTGSQGHGSRDAGSNGDRSSPVSVNSATDSSDEMLAVLGTRRDGDSHLTRDRAQEGHDDELKGSAGEGMAGEGTEKQNSAVVVEASNEAEQPSSADVGGVNESVDAELRSQETSEMMGNKTDVSDTRAAESERKLEKNNQETGPVLVGAGKVQESAVESTEDADRASKSADNDVEKHGKSSETANGQETMKSETESAKPAPTDDAEKSNVRAKTPLLPNNHTPTASTPEGARPDAQQHLQPRAPKTKQPLVGSTPAEQANQNNIRTQTFDTPGRRSFRILMVSHVCGRLHLLNNLAEKSGAKAIVSCGNFGFFDAASYDNLPIHTLRKLLREQKGVLPEHKDKLLEFKEDRLREAMKEQNILSELHNYIQNDAGEAERRLHMPLYALWGANEGMTIRTLSISPLTFMSHVPGMQEKVS
ncbi:hypothetical protein SARC_01994 [Sphaeroforma arctica JP610]|uniref:Uncharacterized protein n=1 Tax=Sphaeroforma arctica JP610 TaxID=667725 RepID=A0A0L0GC53_9EUKA|nr:hypothetical protein SARC_01994 [Sphaeroforma arctica JP610]KNC85848.1 hypothetical protein SARC_01994 [Sphaeroforma arctica JP610]|eukprot:XP_014159750.1 hypothetical protein SARC_01994 [Sphaeroforma arctica JP610]